MAEKCFLNDRLEKIFEEMFCYLDEIDSGIHENSLKVEEENYEMIENSLNHLLLSVKKIEKRLNNPLFYKLERIAPLNSMNQKMLFTR